MSTERADFDLVTPEQFEAARELLAWALEQEFGSPVPETAPGIWVLGPNEPTAEVIGAAAPPAPNVHYPTTDIVLEEPRFHLWGKERGGTGRLRARIDSYPYTTGLVSFGPKYGAPFTQRQALNAARAARSYVDLQGQHYGWGRWRPFLFRLEILGDASPTWPGWMRGSEIAAPFERDPIMFRRDAVRSILAALVPLGWRHEFSPDGVLTIWRGGEGDGEPISVPPREISPGGQRSMVVWDLHDLQKYGHPWRLAT